MKERLTLGMRLRAMRKHRKKDVKFMMAALGISKGSYDAKEREDNDNLNAETIMKLSNALNVGGDYFFLNLTPEEYDIYNKNKTEIFLFSKLDDLRRGMVREMMAGLEFGQRILNKESVNQDFFKRLIRDEDRIKT